MCCLLAAALYCYVLVEEQETPGVWLGCGFAAALALTVLTKGLIGVVFPVAIAGVHLVAVRGWRGALARLRRMPVLPGVLTFLVIAVPWHVLAAVANPGHGAPGDLSRVGGHWMVPLPTDGNVHGWAWFYFVNEQVYRYLNVRVPHDYDTVPLWLFYAWVPLMLLPWAGFLGVALRRVWPLQPGSRECRIDLLLGIWAAVPLLFFFALNPAGVLRAALPFRH